MINYGYAMLYLKQVLKKTYKYIHIQIQYKSNQRYKKKFKFIHRIGKEKAKNKMADIGTECKPFKYTPVKETGRDWQSGMTQLYAIYKKFISNITVSS